MKLLEKVLLATDFGKSAQDALKMALFTAKTFDSEIVLLHVLPEIEDLPVDPDMLKDAVGVRFEKIQEDFAAEGVRVTQTVVASGTPFEHIVQQADLHDANVIVMGAGDKKSREKFPLGITVERVVRRSSKPVWVVKKGQEPPVKKILCPVDFSDPSRRALRNAIHLARRFKAELTVLTVVQPLRDFFLGLRKRATQKEQEVYTKRKQDRFDQFLKEGFDFHNVAWDRAIEQGKPNEEILRIARQSNCDLIVMGSVGLTDSPQILMGRVAEKVIREMPCSVVSVKKADPVRLRVEEEFADAKSHLMQGRKLLEDGYSEEAIRQFQQSIDKDAMYAPAWEGLAAAQDRLGRKAEAEKNRAKARVVFKPLEAERRKGTKTSLP